MLQEKKYELQAKETNETVISIDVKQGREIEER